MNLSLRFARLGDRFFYFQVLVQGSSDNFGGAHFIQVCRLSYRLLLLPANLDV